jgi:hypothetical protein
VNIQVVYILYINIYIYIRKSDNVLTDDDEDSIALRMKRNERRINQQSDGDNDENTSYEY